MLEFEIALEPGLIGDMAARVMSVCPGTEVITDEHTVRFCVPVDHRLDSNLQRLEEIWQKFEKVRGMTDLDVSSRNLAGPDTGPDQLAIGSFLIKKPGVDVTPQPGRFVLSIEAESAFGSGAHPSTQLALLPLERYFRPEPGAPDTRGGRMLDVGTGSGILALAAVSLGAGSVLAVDPSREAIEAAVRNAQAHGFQDRIEFVESTIEQLTGIFDVITANLAPSVLIRTLKKCLPLLAKDGTLITAGFADGQTPQIMRAANKAGLVPVKSESLRGWTGVTMIRGD
jgi:ribosomal protein L11 methylase PrmA